MPGRPSGKFLSSLLLPLGKEPVVTTEDGTTMGRWRGAVHRDPSLRRHDTRGTGVKGRR